MDLVGVFAGGVAALPSVPVPFGSGYFGLGKDLVFAARGSPPLLADIGISCDDTQEVDGIESEPSLVASLWRFKWYIAAAAILAAVAGFGVSMLQSTIYEAQGELLLNDPKTSGGIAEEIGLVLDPDRYVRNQAQVLESPQVAARASEILGGAFTPKQIQDSTSATPATDLDVLAVRASHPTADGAATLVDATVQAYEEVVEEGITSKVDSSITALEQSKADIHVTIAAVDAELADDPGNVTLEAQRTAAIAQLVAVESRIEQLATNAALYGSGVQLYVAPETPTSPVQPRPLRNGAIAMVLGLIGAAAWAWWRSEQDQRIDDRNIPARILDAPLLAAIPEYGDVDATAPNPTVTSPESGAAEAYHFAVSSLGMALDQIGGTTVVVTSTTPGDGKSATAFNMAIAAAQDGWHPLLVDADERVRGLTRLAESVGQYPGPASDLRTFGQAMLEARLAKGMSMDQLAAAIERSPATVRRWEQDRGVPPESIVHKLVAILDLGNRTQAVEIIGEWLMDDETAFPFVAAGSGFDGSPVGYFRSAGFRRALPALAENRDFVVIDAPPVMSAAETTDLVAQADGVIFVVRHGASLRDLVDARERLAMSGTPILGYVYNRTNGKSHGYGYGYGHGYGKDAD